MVDGQQSSVDAALGRVALAVRLIGAVWMLMLAAVHALGGGLSAPAASAGVLALGVGWAAVAWRAGLIDRPGGVPRTSFAIDLLVTCAVILVPGLAGETATFSGGYPFGSLLVGLAAAGRRGVAVAAAVLCAVTLANLGAVAGPDVPTAVGNLLFYLLGAASLAIGLEVLRRNDQRIRRTEAALAVAEERAATAAHLHDSVLQTLALVHRRADDAGAVRSLARRQERELREWLFPPDGGAGGPAGAPPPARSGDSAREGAEGPDRAGGAPQRLGTALARHAEEVEERYGVAVAVVTVGGVGQIPLDDEGGDGLVPLAQAAREAMTNAALHAGVSRVDLFAQQEEDAVVVFVRDRGCGFDIDGVPADRQGVRGSIINRMERAGGVARVTSVAGRGTEVELRMPLPDGSGRRGSQP